MRVPGIFNWTGNGTLPAEGLGKELEGSPSLSLSLLLRWPCQCFATTDLAQCFTPRRRSWACSNLCKWISTPSFLQSSHSRNWSHRRISSSRKYCHCIVLEKHDSSQRVQKDLANATAARDDRVGPPQEDQSAKALYDYSIRFLFMMYKCSLSLRVHDEIFWREDDGWCINRYPSSAADTYQLHVITRWQCDTRLFRQRTWLSLPSVRLESSRPALNLTSCCSEEALFIVAPLSKGMESGFFFKLCWPTAQLKVSMSLL